MYQLSQFQAAIQVLADAGEPMNCKAMVEAMTAEGLWSSPGGKTPEATLYASILRDTRKGEDARFAKADRGLFTLPAGRKHRSTRTSRVAALRTTPTKSGSEHYSTKTSSVVGGRTG